MQQAYENKRPVHQQTYHFDHASHTIRDRDLGPLQTERLSARIAHIRLNPTLNRIPRQNTERRSPTGREQQKTKKNSPRVKGKRRQFGILKVDLERDVVQGGLGSAIGRVGEIALLHACHASGRGAERDELGGFGLVEEGQGGLEEGNDGADVDLKMLPDVGHLDLADWWENLGDASIGDYDV